MSRDDAVSRLLAQAAEVKETKEQKAQRRWNLVVNTVAVYFLWPLVIMLALGIVHSDLWAAVPPLGFWAVYGLYFGVRALRYVFFQK